MWRVCVCEFREREGLPKKKKKKKARQSGGRPTPLTFTYLLNVAVSFHRMTWTLFIYLQVCIARESLVFANCQQYPPQRSPQHPR